MTIGEWERTQLQRAERGLSLRTHQISDQLQVALRGGVALILWKVGGNDLRQALGLAQQRTAPIRHRPQGEIVDRLVLSGGEVGQHAAEPDSEGDAARRGSALAQPRGGGADRINPLVRQILVARSAGAVGGTRKRQPRHRVARPGYQRCGVAQRARAAHLLPSERRTQQHRCANACRPAGALVQERQRSRRFKPQVGRQPVGHGVARIGADHVRLSAVKRPWRPR